MVLLDPQGGSNPPKKKKKKVTNVVSAPTLSKESKPTYTKPTNYNLPSKKSPAYQNRSSSPSSYGWKPTVAPRPAYMPQLGQKPKKDAVPVTFEGLSTAPDPKLQDLFNFFAPKDDEPKEKTGSSGLGGLTTEGHERGSSLADLFAVPERDIAKDPNSEEALVDKGLGGAPKYNKKGEVVGVVGQDDKETKKIQKLLEQLQDPEAPKGTAGPSLPEKYKKDKKGEYKNWWNQDFINAYLSGPEMVYNSDKIRALNEILEHQMEDKESWLLSENARKYNKVDAVLSAAEKAAYEGDFGYLERYMKKNPEFSLQAPKYKAIFGVDSDDVWKAWEQERQNVNKYDAKGLRYRTDMVMRHYDDLQNKAYFRKGGVAKQLGFDQLRTSINERVKAYKDTYGESADFRGVEDKVGSGIPKPRKTDKDALNLYDKAASTQYAKHGGKEGETKRRAQIKREFGLKRLPTVEEMLASKVTSGELDPKDHEAVEAWIWRFKKLDHVETRALIASWARSQGKTESGKKKDLEKKTLEFVNEPIKTYTSSEGFKEEVKGDERRAKSSEKAERSEDLKKSTSGLDFLGDVWGNLTKGVSDFAEKGDEAFYNVTHWTDEARRQESLKDYRNKQYGDSSELMQLLDIAQRPLNAVAGMFDAYYSMDEDDGGTLEGSETIDPLQVFTGQSSFSGLDEIIKDPLGSLGKIGKRGLGELNRPLVGSGEQSLIPFTPESDQVPTLFSNVIANNAMRDPENNVYDNEWYQHTAGFALDMTADPLNFVGIGVVDSAMKAPASAVKRAVETGTVEGKALPTSEANALTHQLLSTLKDTQSPAVQKSFVTNQALLRIGDETEIRYVTKDHVFPENVNLDEVTSARLNKQITDLKIQQAQLKNDVGLEALRDNYAKITGEISSVGSDLRVSKLTKIPGLTTDLSNPGGAIWSRFVQPLQRAAETRSLGRWSSEVFDESVASGRKAAYASRKLRELDETESKLGTSVGINAETRARLNKYLDDAYDAGTAETKYSVEKGLRSGEIKPEIDLAGRVAEASGLSKEAFLKRNMIKPEDADVVMYQASTRGRDLLIQSDPKTAFDAQSAAFRIKDGQRTLDAIANNTGRTFANVKEKQAYIAAIQKNMKIAWAQQSQITAAGLIKYLDVRRDILVKGQDRLTAQLGAKNELEAKLQRITDMAAQESGSGGSGLGGNMQAKRAAESREMNYGSFEGETFDDLEGLVAQRTDEFGSRVEALDAMGKEIRAQIDELDLEDTFEVTGFPPQTAFALEQMLPADSVFKKADGSIDTAKVNEAFEFDAVKNDFQPFRYKGAPDTPEEAEFLDIVKSTLNDEYQGAYRKANRDAKYPNGAVGSDAGDVPLTLEQARAKALGPRPTGESLIKARPGIRQKLMDQDAEAGGGFLKKGRVVEVPSKAGDFEDIRPQVGTEEVRFVGKRTKDQDSWSYYVRGKQREWDRKAEKFEESFKVNAKAEAESQARARISDELGFKLSPGQQKEVVRAAEKETRKKVFDSLEETGSLKQTPGAMRMTVNQSFRDMEKQVKLRAEAKKAELELRIHEIDNIADQTIIKERIRGVENEKKAALRDLNQGRMEAIDTVKVMSKRIKEEHVLALLNEPFEKSYKMLEFRIAGMRFAMRSSQSLFKAAERAGDLVPGKFAEKFKTYFARPTKQLDAAEAVEIRALHTGYGPAIIHAELSRMTSRMDNLSIDQRADMLTAFREGRDYTGPGSGKWEDFKEELTELEDILNGEDALYQFAPPGKKAQPLGLYEIKRFLPAEWQFDPKVLFRSVGGKSPKPASVEKLGSDAEWSKIYDQATGGLGYKDTNPTAKQMKYIRSLGGNPSHAAKITDKRQAARYIDHLLSKKSESGEIALKFSSSGRITVDDLIQAVRHNGMKNPKDIGDPFRLVWVYRLAAAQAAQRKTVMHAMQETFGVSKDLIQKKIPGRGIREFESMGWVEHKELPGYFFPPESSNDIRTLLEFMEPGSQTKIMTAIDTAMGYWKQGMTIYNPAYYSRNGIGEWMTSYLDGIWEPKYYKKAKNVLNYRDGKGQEMAELMRKWTVLKENVFAEPETHAGSHVVTLKGGQRVNAGEVLRLYYEHGLSTTFVNTDLQAGVRSLASTGLHGNKLTKTISRIDKKFRAAGEGFEDYFRLAHFIGVLEKSGKGSLEKAAVEAAQRVRRSHFDYSDFSKFEKTVMLRAYPFYKWIRRGAPLMMAHMFMTPGKMMAPVKIANYAEGMGFDPAGLWTDDPVMSTQDVKEDKNGLLPDYQGIAPGFVRDLFAYQMQPSPDDEYAHYFRFQTPQIDGLNFVTALVAAAGEDSIMDAHGASGGNTLLNPVIKSFLELNQNQNMDPDQPYEIYGGEYNQNMGISDEAAVGTYLARQANPWTALISKVLKNEGVIGKGKDEDYQTSRDLLSFITGLGFYQGKPQDEIILPGVDSGSVGYDNIGELPTVGGVPAAVQDGYAATSSQNSNAGGEYADPSAFYSSGSGRGWINYGNRKRRGWRSFGSGGYSSSGGGFGGIDSDASSGTEFLEFIRKLQELIDQGEVYDG